MKTVICLFCLNLVFLVFRAEAQVSGARVEESVELMSVIARTAGFDEYCMDRGGTYTEDVDEWFRSCADQPVVTMMKELRQDHGLGYDAVMNMAIRLEKEDGVFVLADGAHAELDNRWNGLDSGLFVAHLNRFYRESRFGEFFERHSGFYGRALASFEENVMAYFDQDWYRRFYREEPREKFSVVIGCVNGGACYGPSRVVDGGREVFAIIGYMENDGKPVFDIDRSYVYHLVHEFNHSFVNHLLYENGNEQAMEGPGERLFQFVGRQMTLQAYGYWQTFIHESIVRAAVICYRIDTGCSMEELQDAMLREIQRGFLWTPSLVKLLRKYERHQGRYGSFADFYPNIIKLLEKEADRVCRNFRSALE